MKQEFSNFFELHTSDKNSLQNELDASLVELRSGLGEILAEIHSLEKDRTQLNDTLVGFSNRAEVLLNEGREDLSRKTLTEKHAVSQKISKITDRLDMLIDDRERLETLIFQVQSMKDEASGRVE